MDNPIIISSVSGPPIEVGHPHDGSMLVVTPPYVNPIPASNPSWWLEADSITGLSDNDTIETWPDLSVNEWNATQATSGLRPTYKTNIVNGLPVVRFVDAKGLNMPSAGSSLWRNLSGGTLVFVCRWDPVPPGANKRCGQIRNSTSTITRALCYTQGTSGKFSIGGRRLDADTFAVVDSVKSIDTEWHVWIGVFDYANARARQYIDGQLDGEMDPFQTAGNSQNANTGVFEVGGFYLLESIIGDISTHLVFNRAITTEEISSITSHLALKYGITLP